MRWTTEGKSVVALYPGYHLRVKRLSKGRYWWCLSSVEGKSMKKVRDGIVRCSKEGRNEVEASLCGVSPGYVAELVASRVQGIEWFEKIKEFTPRVGKYLIKS